jgi:hypothetical protein
MHARIPQALPAHLSPPWAARGTTHALRCRLPLLLRAAAAAAAAPLLRSRWLALLLLVLLLLHAL